MEALEEQIGRLATVFDKMNKEQIKAIDRISAYLNKTNEYLIQFEKLLHNQRPMFSQQSQQPPVVQETPPPTQSQQPTPPPPIVPTASPIVVAQQQAAALAKSAIIEQYLNDQKALVKQKREADIPDFDAPPPQIQKQAPAPPPPPQQQQQQPQPQPVTKQEQDEIKSFVQSLLSQKPEPHRSLVTKEPLELTIAEDGDEGTSDRNRTRNNRSRVKPPKKTNNGGRKTNNKRNKRDDDDDDDDDKSATSD